MGSALTNGSHRVKNASQSCQRHTFLQCKKQVYFVRSHKMRILPTHKTLTLSVLLSSIGRCYVFSYGSEAFVFKKWL